MRLSRGGRSGEAGGWGKTFLSRGSGSDSVFDAAVEGSFHLGLKSGCLGGENGGLGFWKMGGRGGVLGETTMLGWESGSCSSLGGDFGGELGSNDMWLNELRPGLGREMLGGSEGVLGVFLRLCVLCRTGVCVVDAC